MLVEVIGQVFRHALGERGHQYALLFLAAQVDFRQQIIDLRLRRAHLEHRINKSRRSYQLLHDLPGMGALVLRGRRRDEHRLRQKSLEFIEAQRPVIECGRQPEAVIDKVFLARSIALVHAACLRNRHMRLVDEHQRSRWKVVDQRRWRFARTAPGQMPRVILDPLAEADLGHHLEVVARPLLDPLRLDQLHLADEELFLLRQLELIFSIASRTFCRPVT
jgi:hypothetical protein